MTDLHVYPLLPSVVTFRFQGKNAHLFYDGNTGARRELFADIKDYGCQIIYIKIKMDSLTETMDTNAEDAAEYQHLSEELEYVKQKKSKDLQTIRAFTDMIADTFADTDLEKIYVYE